MRILAKCPGCGGQIQLTIGHLDRRQRCQACGHLFKIPDAQQLERAIKVAKDAGGAIFVDENGRVYG
jgi:uncharacterized protein (DUF983 family)